MFSTATRQSASAVYNRFNFKTRQNCRHSNHLRQYPSVLELSTCCRCSRFQEQSFQHVCQCRKVKELTCTSKSQDCTVALQPRPRTSVFTSMCDCSESTPEDICVDDVIMLERSQGMSQCTTKTKETSLSRHHLCSFKRQTTEEVCPTISTREKHLPVLW